MKIKILLLLLFGFVFSVYSQEIDSIQRSQLKRELKQEILAELNANSSKNSENKNKLFDWNNFSISGYGVVNYYNYGKYDTDKDIKNKIDAERFNLYLNYAFTDCISLKTEIEFEHGGTGSSIELDTQEEFGEYELEVAAGGEVKLEQLVIDFKIHPYFNVRAGRMKLHFNLSQDLGRPVNYFTTFRPEMENAVLPLGWYEDGISIYGAFFNKKLQYQLYVTSGLDATGFSSRNWIKKGQQSRFEMGVANSFAYALRVDYKFGKNEKTFLGAAAYVNDAAANRPKKDMKDTAYVSIFEGHVNYNEDFLRFSSVFVYGNLENSNIVSRRNASLSNALGVKRTPVGKNMIGFSADVGYEVLHFFNLKTQQKVYPFVRYDYYDTMYKTEGNIVRKPRWKRNTITGGINWFILPEIVFKANYSNRRLGSEHFDTETSLNAGRKQVENTFSLGLAFSF